MPMAAPIAHHTVADHKRWCSRSNGPWGRSNDHGVFGLDGIIVGDLNPVGTVWIQPRHGAAVQPTAVGRTVVFDVISDAE